MQRRCTPMLGWCSYSRCRGTDDARVMHLAEHPVNVPTLDAGQASEALRELAAVATQRSTKSQLLLRVLPDVEAALAAGARRSEVLQRLKDAGLQMSPATFGSALARLRKRRAHREATSTPAESASVADTPPPPPTRATAHPTKASAGTTKDFAAYRAQAHDLDALAQSHRERLRRARGKTSSDSAPGTLEIPQRRTPAPPE